MSRKRHWQETQLFSFLT